MKVLKIFGVVVGIHVFALILIFANPGCSSTNKPSAPDTVSQAEPAPAPVTPAPASDEVPPTIISTDSPATPAAPVSAAPAANDTPASAPVGVRFSPTRPGTAAAAALENRPVEDVTPATTYTVVQGDSLWSIAKKHHITRAELAAANNLKSNAMIKIGQRLIIPGKSMMASNKPIEAAPAKPAKPVASAAPKGEPVKHTVKPGETLGGIARKYQVKYGDIAVANNIADPAKIRPGMVLTIPGWQAPAGKSASQPKPEKETPPAAVPTITSEPAPNADAGAKADAGEPPVIQVDDGTPPEPGKL
jgi:LysM repeat protein